MAYSTCTVSDDDRHRRSTEADRRRGRQLPRGALVKERLVVFVTVPASQAFVGRPIGWGRSVARQV
jgi:hypothetical protein